MATSLVEDLGEEETLLTRIDALEKDMANLQRDVVVYKKKLVEEKKKGTVLLTGLCLSGVVNVVTVPLLVYGYVKKD